MRPSAIRSKRRGLPRAALLIGAAVAVLALPASAQAAPNGRVAFERLNDIFVVNPDGTNVTNLTASKAFEAQPEYSPDGTRLAFVRAPREGRFLNSGRYDVWVMDAAGGSPVKVTDVAGRIESLRWSGDGTRLLFWADRDATEIIAELYAVAPDGSSETTLTAAGPPIDEGGLELSTAKDKVAYAVREPFGNSEVVVSKIDGTGLTRVTADPGEDRAPVLTPDATRIAWSSTRDHPASNRGSELYIANVDGTAPTRLTSTARASNVPAAFSVDGSRLGYDRDGHAALINLDGSSRVSLTKPNTFDLFEEFTPNGSRVVYSHVRPIRGEDPHYTIDTVRPTGAGHKVLVDKAVDPVYGDWQPGPPAPNPPFEFNAEARPRQSGRGVRIAFLCANECDVKLRAKGRAGGKAFRSRRTVHGYGNDRTETKVLSKRARRRVADRHGRVRITATARDQFGAKRTETGKVKLKP